MQWGDDNCRMETLTPAHSPQTRVRPYRFKPNQTDYRVKLACPSCGAVAHMTAKAQEASGGIACANDGTAFVPAPRRVYTPRRTADA